MKKPFQVGDRVVIYEQSIRYTGTIQRICNSDTMLEVLTDDVYKFRVHPKQCRRLVKRKRREIWVKFAPTGTVTGAFLFQEQAEKYQPGTYENAVRFVEAPKQKKNKEKD